ncbi:MAG TPA: LLM class flavin-dependent oxidoreductase [Solirubrobacteraceae bacterium]|jgi:alkanesulfonate monooxygenase SsuD/methylene tetrahydromethanopterin reductase-like flavin-dependent oxidoreductase (luciferase family)|nr:LLM class flavin-dependent oxidoreductase [Solirubrobacteraceae bacterium]
MRVGLLQEGDFAGTTLHARYREMINEVALADELGFSSWGTSEQHFSPPHFSIASPEVLYAAVAEHTSRITLRNMSAVLVAYNHPIMVAERIATLDLISNGRAELCTARSNNLRTLETFQVPTHNTADQWAESIEVVIKAMSQDTFEHHGEFWDIQPCEVIPKPLQKPHPAVSVAATSTGSHRKAGRRGIGVISFDNYFGYGYLDECIREYAEGLNEHGSGNGSGNSDGVNNYFGVYVASAFCAATRSEAIEVARDATLAYFRFILDLYRKLGQKSSYEYMANIEGLAEHQDDMEYMMRATASIMVGTPEDFIEQLTDLERRGVDEVLLRVDGFGHEQHIKAIELLGHEVIPHVDNGDRSVQAREALVGAAKGS